MLNAQLQENPAKTRGTFYLGEGDSVGADYIYDETYKNYKAKQKFEKDPKYNYFNAVMQMKRKLSKRQQVYKKVFESDPTSEPQTNQNQKNKTFYFSKTSNSFIDPECQVVKIQKLKRNSFRIVKQLPFIDTVVGLTKQQSQAITLNKPMTTASRTGHKSNLSLYDKPNPKLFSFEMTSKPRNNKSYVEFQVKEKPIQVHANQSFYQPSNPKPRLEQIMTQYRKINKHSHQPIAKKSSLPKEFVQQLYQTNKKFYSNKGKKRTSLY